VLKCVRALERNNSCCTEVFVMKFGEDVPNFVVISESIHMFVLEFLVKSCACFNGVLFAVVRN
jgi:hypothetical protein